MSEKVRVTEIITKTKKVDNPVILDFQNGELQPNADVNFFKAKDSHQPNKEMAVITTKNSVYHGYINDDLSSNLVNNFLAIRNKSTGKVRLVQVDNVSLLNDIYHKQEIRLGNQLAEQSARSMMIKQFGGRFANRALERTERMKVSVDVVKNQLDKTLEESIVNEEELNVSIDETNINKIRPPFNADAKRVEDIYNLVDIIPAELLEKLNEEAKAVVENDPDSLPIDSEYLKKKLNAVKSSAAPDSSRSLTQVKMLIYMDALQNLIKGREKDLRKATFSNITERVENDIRLRFCEPNMASMKKTRFTKEKAICYYIALAMLTSGEYEMDVNTLSAELSMSRQTVIKYAQLVYARPISKTDLISLRLPSKVKIGTLFTGRRRKH